VFTLESHAEVPRLTGAQIADFMLECDDDRYRSWWPGTHLAFHRVEQGWTEPLGDRVLMDEYVGSRRIRMHGEVVEATPGERIV